jgi:threonylcarbamoyladenosine tRNA methylthiotransferase MtaB
VSDVPTGISRFGDRYRAYVKVQDGCRMQCSYCIIPLVRPVLRSRPVSDVLEEVRRLVDNGHREIVLTGIHLGHYGAEAPDWGVDLAGLVRQVVELPGEFRVRISSLEAAEVTAELIAVMADRGDRVCPHLHLSMQSGSDAVLTRMRRRWPAARFLETCAAVRRRLDHPALTTDVIVGFPGETADDFLATCKAAEAAGFSKIHIFRFSPRKGTPAAKMPDRLPAPVVQQRAAELAQLAARLRQRFFEGLVGRELQVLVEEPATDHLGRVLGTCSRYAPVELAGGKEMIGQLVRATAEAVASGRVFATAPGIARPWSTTRAAL